MRSERSPGAGSVRRTTFIADEVVKTFFDGWATMEHGMKAVGRPTGGRRPSGGYPLASGEGAA